MDLFPDGTRVRLKNRARGTYLAADEDGIGVSLSVNREAPNAAWEVRQEMKLWDLHFNCLLLRSAASGRFLALAPDHRGRRVAQRVYEEGGHPGAFMWRAIRTEDGGDEFVVLLHVLGLAVRADDGSFNGVAADDLENMCEAMHWFVEVDEADPLRPALPDLPLAEASDDDDDGGADAADVHAEDAADGNGGGVLPAGDGGADQVRDDDPVDDGEDDDQQAAADGAADGNGEVVVLPAADGVGVPDQRQAARLYDRLDNLYVHMNILYEEAREHHQGIQHIKEQAKAIGDWSRVKKAVRPHYQDIEKIERSYNYQVSLASNLRLELVRLGFPPLEEPAGLKHPNQLRRS